VEDLYRRLETVIFSPQALINCWYMKNPPWLQIDRDKSNRGELQADHEAVTANVRKILELRMAFVPYLYSAFNEYRLNGTPPIRALVMDWPQDPKVRDVDDQYMFGASVMVAPMFAGQVNRQVYLPTGDWYDFWTGQKLAGGESITVTNDQQHIPLFVKSGSLLPLAEPVEHIEADTCFQVVVHSYGPNPADFVLYEDDGTSDAYATGQQNRVRLHWDATSPTVVRQGKYSQPPRYQVVDWKANP
jgi:alpha-D-xyloside xylohydrolase